MPKQMTFASLAHASKKKVTRREKFLTEMAAVVPWSRLMALNELHYPKMGSKGGRPAMALEVMLRIYCLQQSVSGPKAVDGMVGGVRPKQACGSEHSSQIAKAGVKPVTARQNQTKTAEPGRCSDVPWFVPERPQYFRGFPNVRRLPTKYNGRTSAAGALFFEVFGGTARSARLSGAWRASLDPSWRSRPPASNQARDQHMVRQPG